MSQIFINYRREDSSAYVHAIYQSLCQRFSEDDVFYDRETITPGADFVEIMQEAAQGAGVLITIIGPRWLTLKDAGENRRLDNPNDAVRSEIEHALREDVVVIPVLVGGATMPLEEDLPDSLRPLARRNGIAVSDDHFRHDMERLGRAIERVIGKRQHREPVRPDPQPPPPRPTHQATPQQQQSPPTHTGPKIPNYLVWSIISTLCCFPITGIVAIVFTSKANTAVATGNFEEAKANADKARLWNMISLGIGAVLWFLYLIIFVFMMQEPDYYVY